MAKTPVRGVRESCTAARLAALDVMHCCAIVAYAKTTTCTLHSRHEILNQMEYTQVPPLTLHLMCHVCRSRTADASLRPESSKDALVLLGYDLHLVHARSDAIVSQRCGLAASPRIASILKQTVKASHQWWWRRRSGIQ